MFIPTAVISTKGRNLLKFGRSLPSVEMTVFLKPLLRINKKTSVHAVLNQDWSSVAIIHYSLLTINCSLFTLTGVSSLIPPIRPRPRITLDILISERAQHDIGKRRAVM